MNTSNGHGDPRHPEKMKPRIDRSIPLTPNPLSKGARGKRSAFDMYVHNQPTSLPMTP